ncbi:protein YhfH [Calidifontibacillus oryziterrae]|nr:protein YhfH [Calidifontibacillus oryziterrae]
MVQSSTEFFKTLPPKYCCDCGAIIDEHAESYMNHCDHCLRDIK